MKRLPRFSALAFATFMTVSAPVAMAAEAPQETVKRFYQAFNENKPDLLDSVQASDWQDIPENPGQGPGREGFKPLVSGWSKVFANLKITNDEILVAGNKVIVRSTVEGDQVGDFAGLPAKGRHIRIMAIDIHEFKNGKVIRTWHVEDWLRGLGQMGAFEK